MLAARSGRLAHLAAAGRADHELRVAAHARGWAVRRAARRPQLLTTRST
jgi:hypothetical protein